jgi:hypothetical protein
VEEVSIYTSDKTLDAGRRRGGATGARRINTIMTTTEGRRK